MKLIQDDQRKNQQGNNLIYKQLPILSIYINDIVTDN